MDRFSWTDGVLGPEETLICQESGIKLYDGENKTSFMYGKLNLLNHRLLWRDARTQNCCISLHLCNVVYAEMQSSGHFKGSKIVLHLNPAPAYKAPGPCAKSPNNYIKLSFKERGEKEFFQFLTETLSRKAWEKAATTVIGKQPVKQLRAGIVGIERNLQKKHEATDKSISHSFEDLSQLIEKAKEMVALSKSISMKICEKQGAITEDETIQFKSHLLSLGIHDPVTRESHGSENSYHIELAKEISSLIESPLNDCGGIMALTDVYCRLNRARGLELLSPEDVINACKVMNTLHLPVRYHMFESGVMVLQLSSQNNENLIKQTLSLVNDHTALTANELSQLLKISVVLSKERLIAAEHCGAVCRDETVEGLRFFPNKFLESN